MKLYVINSGIYPAMPRELLVSTGGLGDPNAIVPIPTVTYLIHHPDGLVLYDTGWSRTEQPLQSWTIPDDALLLNSLAKTGVRPEDVKYVICSHLHPDHAGNLDYFINAEIIVSDLEFTNAAKRYVLNECPPQYVKKDMEEWVRLGLKWRLLSEQEKPIKLFEGINILSFGPGHSYGMLGLLLELPKTGNVILTSDAIYCSENIGPPVQPPGNSYDPDGYLKTMNRILQYAKEYDAKLWYGHDMEQFNGLIKSDVGYYE